MRSVSTHGHTRLVLFISNQINFLTFPSQHLTALTNEEIVAELGWTRAAIKRVLGVTPTTMRPPYGDIGEEHQLTAPKILPDDQLLR